MAKHGAIEHIRELEARLVRNPRLPISAVTLSPPLPRGELVRVEETIGVKLPVEYVEFVTAHGLFQARVEGPLSGARTVARMLSPDEIIAQHRHQGELMDGASFGYDDPDDEAAAIEREARVRRALIPFQYVPPYESDFFCFYPPLSRAGQPLIAAFHHDDWELGDWLLANEPAIEDCTFSFDEHLCRVIDQLAP